MSLVVIVMVVAAVFWARSPRWGGRGGRLVESQQAWRETVEELRVEIDDLRHELDDTRERLEFAERLLASSKERERAPLEGGAIVMDRSMV